MDHIPSRQSPTSGGDRHRYRGAIVVRASLLVPHSLRGSWNCKGTVSFGEMMLSCREYPLLISRHIHDNGTDQRMKRGDKSTFIGRAEQRRRCAVQCKKGGLSDSNAPGVRYRKGTSTLKLYPLSYLFDNPRAQ